MNVDPIEGTFLTLHSRPGDRRRGQIPRHYISRRHGRKVADARNAGRSGLVAAPLPAAVLAAMSAALILSVAYWNLVAIGVSSVCWAIALYVASEYYAAPASRFSLLTPEGELVHRLRKATVDGNAQPGDWATWQACVELAQRRDSDAYLALDGDARGAVDAAIEQEVRAMTVSATTPVTSNRRGDC